MPRLEKNRKVTHNTDEAGGFTHDFPETSLMTKPAINRAQQ